MRRNPRIRGVAAGAISGVLYALTFPPAGQGWLVFLALVPLFAHLRSRDGRGGFLPFFVFGTVSHVVGLFWLHTVLTHVGTVLLALLLTVLYIVWIGVFAGELLRRGYSLLVAAPLAWVAWEWIRTWLATGFPWLYAAHGLAGWTTFIQGADLLGTHVISAAVVLVNAGIVQAAFAARAGRGVRSAWRLAPGAALVALLFAYGAWRLPRVEERNGPVVLVVQGNVPQLMKTEALRRGEAELSRMEILDRQTLLTRQGLAADPEAGIVIWAETMFPFPFTDVPGAAADRDRAAFEFGLRQVGAAAGGRPVIFGALYRTAGGDLRNSAFLAGPGGEAGSARREYAIRGRYDKLHAVPGSEYIPFRSIAPEGLVRAVSAAVRDAAGYVPDLTEGEEVVLLEAAGVRFAPLVCYEISFPALVRDACDAGADVLLNLSNYGWFPETIQPDQANQAATFRAVEARRPVVVVANTGISGVISARGRIEELVVGGEKRDVAGMGAFRVPLSTGNSVSHALGGAPGLAALLACVLLGVLRRRRDARDGPVSDDGR